MLEQDIFDYVIRNYQIQPGETIIGIVPLKTEKKLAKIEKVKFTLKDIFKRSYEFNIELENIGGEGQGYLQSLSMEVLDKNVDLSKFISP